MIEQIPVTELKALMDGGGAHVVDVREKWEYDGGHVPGAVWLVARGEDVPTRMMVWLA